MCVESLAQQKKTCRYSFSVNMRQQKISFLRPLFLAIHRKSKFLHFSRAPHRREGRPRLADCRQPLTRNIRFLEPMAYCIVSLNALVRVVRTPRIEGVGGRQVAIALDVYICSTFAYEVQRRERRLVSREANKRYCFPRLTVSHGPPGSPLSAARIGR